MASSLQLHKDWQTKVEEVRQLNVALSSKRIELDDIESRLVTLRTEYDTKTSELERREKELKEQSSDVRVALARSEAAIVANIDRLNDTILAKKGEISDLEKAHAAKTQALVGLQTSIDGLQGDIQRLLSDIELKNEEFRQAQKLVSGAIDRLHEVEEQVTAARADLEAVRAESKDLTARKRDLDMLHKRIKGYYKKAGLQFIDELHVRISSN